ncbi:MAG: membrane protein insertase YidC [Coleofasciculaceae cyanobacterium SM2_1_6]|nr:membrane protein insertase YidC [Coleofasciculaceae cyanobacterium SM2_1_6]
MDFGIGFLSNNVMLPILDFFYGIWPSYGLAIVALTLVVRFAVFPLNAGQIRNMRQMKISQPMMKKRQEEIQKLYKDDPTKQQEEMSKLFKEFNPLAGCLPLLLQMPVLFALFATLRGSPFANINYTVDVQVLPPAQMELIQPQTFSTKPQNIYIADGVHAPILAELPKGNRLVVGETAKVEFKGADGKALSELLAPYPDNEITPTWTVTKGENTVQVKEDGSIVALDTGDATIQGTIPGIAANKGFLFIDALGRVGAYDPDGTIHWDVLALIIMFGTSVYVSQQLSSQGSPGDQQQATVNKMTPIIFSGMFLFFPLPAGVLMYMVVANIFQTVQTFFLMREPLPENLQKMAEEQAKEAKAKEGKAEVAALPFEPKSSKKKTSN